MNKTQTAEQNRQRITAIRKIDDLSLRLCRLTNIVKLAAFAVEARRVLNGIQNAVAFQADMQEFIDDCSDNPNQWGEMVDTAGEVLSDVAAEMDSINTGFTRTFYDYASGDAVSSNANANDKGGAV